jgi:hypothetical protein
LKGALPEQRRGDGRLWRCCAALLAVAWLALAAPTPLRAEPAAVTARLGIEVNARPVPYFSQRDPSRVQFGALRYLGGVSLTSSFSGFGGLSALALDADGRRFVSLSDKGAWFTGEIVYRDGRVAGLRNVETAPLRGPDGRPITSHGWFDSESLTFDGDTAYVGLERVNQILRFPSFGGQGVEARGEPVAGAPPALRRLPYNKGLEALVFVPRGRPLGGSLIAISERGLDAAGDISAFLVGGEQPGAFSIRRRDDYDVSDACLLPDGDMLLLERKFSLVNGVGIRIRRLPLNAIAPGAVVDGAVLFEADLGNEIDNFEGIAVHRGAEDEVVVTLLSDDNFSPIQRTLLLQFRLIEP